MMDLITINTQVNSSELIKVNAKLNEIIEVMISVNRIASSTIYQRLVNIPEDNTFNDYVKLKLLGLLSINEKYKTKIHDEYLNFLFDNWKSLIYK